MKRNIVYKQMIFVLLLLVLGVAGAVAGPAAISLHTSVTLPVDL